MDEKSITIALAIGMLTLGFVIGYGSSIFFSKSPAPEGSQNQSGPEGSFVLDVQKVNEIKGVFEDYFYVTSNGREVAMAYKSFKEYPNYIELIYDLEGQDFSIYISKDYSILYPNVLSFDQFRSQVEDAKAEMEGVQEEEQLHKSEKPDVLLFVMSFCPWGNVAEEAMAPVIDLMADEMDFEPVYIVSRTSDGWVSLHGNQELNQDVREKIIYNLYGAKKWAEYVGKINDECDSSNADNCWEGIAEELEINTTEVENYFNNETKFNEILEHDNSLVLQYGVRGSPTLIINGKTMNIARTSESYKNAICSAYLEPPESCSVTLSSSQGSSTGSCG